MEFSDKIKGLVERVKSLNAIPTTEEAAKNALVMPFISALGYDVFNPTEVVPEFTADVGTKNGEKVDYAIIKDNKPCILIECKRSENELNDKHASQLTRYFNSVESKIAILTNGVIYKFYSDLENTNKMDSKPFLEFNFLDLPENIAGELENFSKDKFSLDEILPNALDLKYTKEIKAILGKQMIEPEEDFLRFFASRVHSGKMTKAVKEQFDKITKKALSQFINEHIREKFNSVLGEAVTNQPAEPVKDEQPKEASAKDGIKTTQEELESFQIVKAILREVVDPNRVFYRDAKSYFSIILDDNNRKPICRLNVNTAQSQLGLVDSDHNVSWVKIENLNDLFSHADHFKQTVGVYLKSEKPKN